MTLLLPNQQHPSKQTNKQHHDQNFTVTNEKNSGLKHQPYVYQLMLNQVM